MRVHAAALNFPDLLMTQGKYQHRPPLPFVAGIESWVPMLVLPLGFGLLALRFVLSAFAPRPIDEPAP